MDPYNKCKQLFFNSTDRIRRIYRRSSNFNTYKAVPYVMKASIPRVRKPDSAIEKTFSEKSYSILKRHNQPSWELDIGNFPR